MLSSNIISSSMGDDILCAELRTFFFKDDRKDYCPGGGFSFHLTVYIAEDLNPDYGMYVWPSAPVLAQYVWYNRNLVKNKKVLEIGAGTSLPGIVAAKCGAHITFSDDEKKTHCRNICKKNVHMNKLNEKNFKIIGLTWGSFSPSLLETNKIDIILGSDCFYDPNDFEDILALVSFILKRNPEGRFWCTYQERSSDWSIERLLQQWSLHCEHIPLENFDANVPNIANTNLPGSHTIHFLEITLKTPE